MAVPPTQHTAPVLEFRCLFTPDLRRKQKRWQDGRLKFHTHNKRVMVYDERANYVGDTHWREDYMLAEGEELQLERGGIMVEVSECIGKTDQDLTELVDKRVKEKEERAAALAQRGTPMRGPAAIQRFDGTPGNHQIHKPLNALLTPSGHHGRAAIPITSPFEEKNNNVGKANAGRQDERPAKRQRLNENVQTKSGYAQNLMGATLSLSSSRPQSSAPIRYEPFRPTITPKPPPVDLTLDESSGDEPTARRHFEKGASQVKPKQQYRRSPPPKSGYASNLTGATLNLGAVSSRSLASQPRRNQPIELDGSSEDEITSGRAVSKMSRPIDHSVQRSKPSEPKTNRQSLHQEKEQVSRNTSLHEPRKSALVSSSSSSHDSEIEEISHQSPEKQTVESSKRKRTVQKTTQKDQPKKSKQPKTAEMSRAVEILAAMSDIESDQAPPKPKRATKQTSKDKPSHKVAPSELPSSPSAQVQNQAPARRKSAEQPVEIDSNGSIPQRTTSSLRIKSRPPRRMMMFMERPLSRTSSNSRAEDVGESVSVKVSSTRKKAGKPREVVMSQATAQLDAFCQKQEQRLKARLETKKVPRNIKLVEESEEEDVSKGVENPEEVHNIGEAEIPQMIEHSQPVFSSFTDGGMDHVMIDEILARKNSMPEKSRSVQQRQKSPIRTPFIDIPISAVAKARRSESKRPSPRLKNPIAVLSSDHGPTATPAPNTSEPGPKDASKLVHIPKSKKQTVKESENSSSPEFEPLAQRAQDSSSIQLLKADHPQNKISADAAIQPSKPLHPVNSKQVDESPKPWLSKKVPDLTKAPTRPLTNVPSTADLRRPKPVQEALSKNVASEADVVEENTSKAAPSDDQTVHISKAAQTVVVEEKEGKTGKASSKDGQLDIEDSSSDGEEEESAAKNVVSHDTSNHKPGEEDVQDHEEIALDDATATNNEETDLQDALVSMSTPISKTQPEETDPQSSPTFPISPALPMTNANAKNNNVQDGGIQSATSHFRSMLSARGPSSVNEDSSAMLTRREESRKTIPEKEEDPLLSSEYLHANVNIKKSPHATQAQGGLRGPGQCTLELAEEVSSTPVLADIPAAPVPRVQEVSKGKRIISNPATTRSGRSLSELAASTRDAPALESSLSLSSTINNSNNNNIANAMMLPPGQNSVVPDRALHNLNKSLHVVTRGSHRPIEKTVGTVGGSSGALQNLPTFESKIAKRIYPPAPPKRHTGARGEQVLHGDEYDDGREQLANRYHQGGGGLLLGGAIRHQRCRDDSLDIRNNRSDGSDVACAAVTDVDQQSAVNATASTAATESIRSVCDRDVGTGVIAGPWSREAFDLFGAWFRPKPAVAACGDGL